MSKPKETSFMQRRFRKNKADSQEKRKSQLLEQEIPTQAESSPTKTTEKINNVEQESKDFDEPRLETKSGPLDSDHSNQSSGKESSKNSDEKKSDNQSSSSSSTQEYDRCLSINVGHFEAVLQEPALNNKRSLSFSSKVSPRVAPLRRANSNVAQNNYSKCYRRRN